MEDLGIQLQAVKLLNLKEYSESSHLDRVWMDICDKCLGTLEGKADALIKFVKIICSLPNQTVSWRERVFRSQTNCRGQGIIIPRFNEWDKTVS